jgi:hypothetical protein
MRSQMFYQEFPERLRSSYVKLVIALALCGPVAYLLRPSSPMFWMVIGLAVLAILLLLYNTAVLLELQAPMLTVDNAGMLFRRVAVPWTVVKEIRTLQIPSLGEFVGLVPIDDMALRSKRASGMLAWLITLSFHRNLAKHGVILIPRAKGLTASELMSVIQKYRPQGERPRELS